jgi:hypothetical protein
MIFIVYTKKGGIMPKKYKLELSQVELDILQDIVFEFCDGLNDELINTRYKNDNWKSWIKFNEDLQSEIENLEGEV